MTDPEPEEEKWSDFVGDLWDHKLPHFRRKGHVYSSNPSSPAPITAEESAQSLKVLKDLIHYRSETNLMELADENAHVLESVPPEVASTPEPGMNTNIRRAHYYKYKNN